MTDFCTFEIPKFGVFAFFVNLSNPSVGKTFPNKRVKAFQTYLLKIFTLQNNLSGLRLTISSRNWKKIVTSIWLRLFIFNCMDNCCFIGSESHFNFLRFKTILVDWDWPFRVEIERNYYQYLLEALHFYLHGWLLFYWVWITLRSL